MIQRGDKAVPSTVRKMVRCAIYTRKSTEDNLEADTNSLEVQREHAEHYIASQAANHWICLPDHYDDGGWTGANTERPAFQQLMRDIEAGLVDCVVVYKIDRLSRSLADFVTTYETFQKHGVSFVSVTQAFNTNDSVGRLVMHILLSFAEFEREQSIERVRHKMASLRRKGKWAGGRPILGYDIAPNKEGAGYLVVNPVEAEQVVEAFETYLRVGSLLDTARHMNAKGYRSKVHITVRKKRMGGLRYDKSMVRRLLANPLYTGRVHYAGEMVPGEHPAIITEELWSRVNDRIRRQTLADAAERRKPKDTEAVAPLLNGLAFCQACDCALTHVRSSNSSRRQYFYYTCTKAIKQGRDTCPTKSVPAAELERFVVGQLRNLAADERFRADVARGAQEIHEAERQRLERERETLAQAVEALERSVKRAGNRIGRDMLEELAAAQSRLEETRRALAYLPSPPTAPELLAATEQYDPVWGELTPEERRRFVRLLVEKVVVDGANQRIGVKYRAAGFRQLGRREAGHG